MKRKIFVTNICLKIKFLPHLLLNIIMYLFSYKQRILYNRKDYKFIWKECSLFSDTSIIINYQNHCEVKTKNIGL